MSLCLYPKTLSIPQKTTGNFRKTGVQEYWIVNPATRIVNVYDFEKETGTAQYTFDDKIPVCIYPGLSVGIADLL